MALLSHLQDEQRERLEKSIRLCIAASILFAVLLSRLFYLQIIQARENIRLSQENGMQFTIQKAPRGLILDRNGVVLARNRPSYSIGILPYKIKNRRAVIANLCSIRDSSNNPAFDSTELKDLIRRAFQRRFDVTRLKEDVFMDIVSIIEEHSMELPGIIVETESRREYLLGSATFHALGYMSEIPENQFDSLKKLGYHYGDMIGKAGIEKQYEDILRGKDGQEYVEVDAYGRSLGPITTMPRVDPIPGNNMYCTIDISLQKMAKDSFPDSLKGAVVALNPKNGEVLAMFSSPAPDPNIFSQASNIRAKSWVSIALDSTLPLNNRATCGVYPPGSTFKLVSGIAGLASGKISAESHMPTACHGSYRLGARIARCWKPQGHGSCNLVDAIRQSCDVYFYQVGLRLGDKLINQYAALFGFGKPTGIDFPIEKAGWLSGEEEYNKRFASRKWVWTKGLDMDLAIGQTQLVTPIQLASMVGAMGNGKALYRPFLLREVRNAEGMVIMQNKPVVIRNLDIDMSIIEIMRRSMLAVTEAGGTAGRAQVPHVPVGGKTGSAENPHGEKTHALFGGCAPYDDPVIAVAVVAENAGHGGSIAAPVAGALLRYYFANTAEGKRLTQIYRDVEAVEKKSAAQRHSDNE
jgi:penicillin-binding protein 2